MGIKRRMSSWRMDVAKKRDREWSTRREFKSCKSKLIHHNYLDAMRHAQAIEHCRRKGQEIHIYPCEYCGAIHVGRSRTGWVDRGAATMRRSLRKMAKIMEHPGFQEKASEEAKKKMYAVRDQLQEDLAQWHEEKELFQNADLEGNALKKVALNGASAFQSRP